MGFVVGFLVGSYFGMILIALLKAGSLNHRDDYAINEISEERNLR